MTRRRGRTQDRLSTLKKWPLGLRLCRPSGPHRNTLRAGYQFEPLENSTDSYRFSAITDTSGVLSLFEEAQGLFTSDSFFILEFYPQERRAEAEQEGAAPTVYYSPYLDTGALIGLLRPYLTRLIHDGFVGFGLANNHQGLELFYNEEKVVTCFTENHIRAMDLFSRQGLPHNPNLLFPTDFAHDHFSLLCFRPQELPEELGEFAADELDYARFCQELIELFDMYPVDDMPSFHLSEREQDLIRVRLEQDPTLEGFAEEDFGLILFDWIDFARECQEGFNGDLFEYCQFLGIRDLLQFVIEGVPEELSRKLSEIVTEADARLQQSLAPGSRRLDPPAEPALESERSWYHGILRKAGSTMRRDLIRNGLYG